MKFWKITIREHDGHSSKGPFTIKATSLHTALHRFGEMVENKKDSAYVEDWLLADWRITVERVR